MKLLTQKILLSAASLTLVLAVCEVGVRLLYGEEHAPRPIFYQKDDRLGWSPTPGLDNVFFGGDFSIHIRTDSMGNRLGTLGEWDRTSKLVVLVGDSNTFGWGVDTGETFASRLDTRLRHEGLAVVNLGVGGYGTSQAALRLEGLASRVVAERVDTVIMLHTRNDMTDNVSFLLFENGYRRHLAARAPRSRSHLVNLVRQGIANIRAGNEQPSSSKNEADSSDDSGRDEDVLFAFPLRSVDREPLPLQATRDFAIDRREITQVDTSPSLTLRRACLSELQYRLVAAHVERINCAFAGAGVRVVHALIDSDPRWMEEVYREIVTSSDTCGAPVYFRGRASIDGFVGKSINSHSGGHFTPALNEHYAEIMGGWIDQEDFGVLVDVARRPAPSRHAMCAHSIPRALIPPYTGDHVFTRVEFEDPLEQNHVSRWNYRLDSLALTGSESSLTCDIAGSEVADASQYGGVRFSVDGLGVLEFELSFEKPEGIRVLYVDGYGKRGKRLLRWIWNIEPIALPTKPEVHVLVPGHGSGYLMPLEGDSGEEVTQVHVFVRLAGPNRRTSFTIRDVRVAPPLSSQVQPAASTGGRVRRSLPDAALSPRSRRSAMPLRR